MPAPRDQLPPRRSAAQPARRSLDARAQQARVAAAFGRGTGRGMVCLLAIGLIWVLAAAYYLFMPPVYFSRWSLILPASNSGSTISLEKIGQASTTPGQPFGSVSLSPKVIYREIATSDQIRERAAGMLGMTPSAFGKVRVRLIDETLMMSFQIAGSSAEQSRTKARALNMAFSERLEALRRDELEKRSGVMREGLTIYQANLERARARALEFQRETGLLSANQFTETVQSLELMRRRLVEKRADREKAAGEVRQYIARMGIPPETAAAALRLTADPGFAKLTTTFAEGQSTLREHELRYGPAHPTIVGARMKRDGALAQIKQIVAQSNTQSGKSASVDLPQLLMVVGEAQHAELLRQMMTADALNSGLAKEIQEIESSIIKLESETARMGIDASKLEGLMKDQLVAEAVLSSATARLDTNRTDVYSSYPLVQVLSEPDLPESRSQPRLIYALASGLLGTLIVLLAWGAAWVRKRFVRKRSKSV